MQHPAPPTVTSRRWLPWLAGAVVLAAIVIAGFFLFPRRSRALTDKDTVVLSEFVNTTGDAVFDGTLKQALAVQLEQSPYLNLLPESKILNALKFMGRKPDERITKDLAREIALRENAKAIISGSITSLGNNYVITLEANNAQTGDSLARQQAEAAGKEQVLKSLDKAATDLRAKLGESLSSVQQFATPLEQATTSSLDALKEFSVGNAAHLRLEDPEAIPSLQRAVALDPNFAMAHAVLGVAYNNTGSSTKANEALKKAYDLRDRASEKEKFYIEGHYYDIANADEEKAVELYENWTKIYSHQTSAWDNLSLSYQTLGYFDKALAAAKQAQQADPKDGFSFTHQVACYTYTNRLDEAKAVAESAISQKLDSISTHFLLFDIAVLHGDQAAIQLESSWGKGTPHEAFVTSRLSSYQDAVGKVRLSRETGQRATELAKTYGFTEMPATILGTQAVHDALHGFTASARQKAAELPSLSHAKGPRAAAAVTFAIIGDSAQSQKLIDELNKDFPSDTILQTCVLPTARARNLLHQNRHTDAVAALEPGRKYELGWNSAFCAYAVIYTRGEAYLQLHDGAKAAAEFQKILDNPGISAVSTYPPLAKLQIARAYVLQGDNAKARTAYQDFFARWKDADPDVPIFLQAKSEYAKLP